MKSMMEWTKNIQEKAKENINEAQKKQKQYFDAKHRPPTFKVGDKVWLFNSRKDTCKGGKLDYNWHGPYEIIEQNTKGTYRLKQCAWEDLKTSIRLKAHIVTDDKKLMMMSRKQKMVVL